MTREEMIEFVNDSVNFIYTLPMAVDHDDDYLTVIKKWVAQAKPEWLDILLDVAVNPPEDVKDNDSWLYEVSMILGEWARNNPSMVLPNLYPLLSHKRGRLVILDALVYCEDEVDISLLRPLTDHWKELSERELIDVINLIYINASQEAEAIIKQLEVTVPKLQTRVHNTLQETIKLIGLLRKSRFNC